MVGRTGTAGGEAPGTSFSRDEAYSVRELVTVAPLTTRIRHIPLEVLLNIEDDVPKPCAVNLDTITTIARISLRDRLTSLSAEKKKGVEAALHFALGMES